ncbi:hypothetical protein FACS1894103_5960 [Campylobacterota bacterium]|nr:hypothetical protein FACS1894103_5960 [Campylobacterota bacterium]
MVMQDSINLKQFTDKRTKCMVYTRVMGYHRPVESFNLGKRGEHNQRVKFIEARTGCGTFFSQNPNNKGGCAC